MMVCKNCGAEINDDSSFCLKCGQPIENDTGKKICPKCGNEVDKDSQFCNKCGFDFDVNKSTKTCPSCGANIENEALFCNKCGFNFKQAKPKKKINKSVLIIAIAIVLFVAGVGGYLAYSAHQRAVAQALYEEEQAKERERQKLIYSYQCKAKEIYDEIKGCGSNFNMLDSMFDLSTDTNGGLLGPSFFVNYTKSLCSSEISTEKTRLRTLNTLVQELESIDCNEVEIQELKPAITEYYEAYKERYDLLIEGNFTSYTFDNLNSSTKKNLSDREKTVGDMLKDIDFTQSFDDEINDTINDEEASDV